MRSVPHGGSVEIRWGPWRAVLLLLVLGLFANSPVAAGEREPSTRSTPD
jgi:hypothetical protein